jgi:hypothetical protein
MRNLYIILIINCKHVDLFGIFDFSFHLGCMQPPMWKNNLLMELEWQFKCSKMTGKLAFISGHRAFRYLSSTLFKIKMPII